MCCLLPVRQRSFLLSCKSAGPHSLPPTIFALSSTKYRLRELTLPDQIGIIERVETLDTAQTETEL